MSVAAVLDAAHQAGMVLTVEAGRLRYRAPVGAVTEELRAALQQHRDTLIAALRTPQAQLGGWSVTEGQRQRGRAAELIGEVHAVAEQLPDGERPDVQAPPWQQAQQRVLDALAAEDSAAMDEALARVVCLVTFEQRQRATALGRIAQELRS